jgi:hypothetical protein
MCPVIRQKSENRNWKSPGNGKDPSDAMAQGKLSKKDGGCYHHDYRSAIALRGDRYSIAEP